MIKWNEIFRNLAVFGKKNLPAILTGFGIAGMGASVVMAVRATPKAKEKIEQAKKEGKHEKLTTMQTVKATALVYLPSALSFAAGAACVVGAHNVHSQRNAAISAAYSVASTSLDAIKNKLPQVVGEQSAKAVAEAIDKDRVEQAERQITDIHEREELGTVLCLEALTGQLFYSSRPRIDDAVNKANYGMSNNMENYISLNEFFQEIDSPDLQDCALGDTVGWNSRTGLISVGYSSQLSRNGVPVLVVDYNTMPVAGYDLL